MSQGLYNFKLSDEALETLIEQGHYSEYVSQTRRSTRSENALEIQVLDDQDAFYQLKLSGVINQDTVSYFNTMINNALIQTQKKIILDFKGISSMNSFGLSALFAFAQQGMSNRFILTNLNSSIIALLDMSGISKLLTIKESLLSTQ